MTFAPSRKFLSVLRLRLFLGALPIAAILGITYFYNQIPTLTWSVGIFVPLIFVWVVFLPILFKSQKAVLEKEALWVYKGVIVKRRHVIPYCRPLYCKICCGPITWLFGICTVKIRLVGGDLCINGLSRKDALFLVSSLESKYDRQ
ncbi:MAG: PH domain-containing protein [Clostridia bacterium]|nr:PH domain-containing protein [Clostridia bacterium]